MPAARPVSLFPWLKCKISVESPGSLLPGEFFAKYHPRILCESPDFRRELSIIIKRTETQLSRLCVFSLLQPHRTEVRLTGKYRYLTFEDRKKIEAWHLLGDRPVDIAARLSVHHTTIYKELQRGATGTLDANQREGYSAELAERRLRESFKRRGKRAPAAQ